MRKRTLCVLLFCAALALSAASLCCRPRPGAGDLANCAPVNRLPHIRPDYSGTVIPPNIAPMNFVVEEPGAEYYVRISSKRGDGIEISSGAPVIEIPLRPWKKLLAANRGEDLRFDLCVRPAGGRWERFNSVVNKVAQEEMDGYLVYRLINPLYNLHSVMSIRQRNLQDFDETVLLDSRDFRDQCMNCHSFLNNRPDHMIVQARGATGACSSCATGALTKVDTRTKLNPGPCCVRLLAPERALDRLLGQYAEAVFPFRQDRTARRHGHGFSVGHLLVELEQHHEHAQDHPARTAWRHGRPGRRTAAGCTSAPLPSYGATPSKSRRTATTNSSTT